MNQEVDSHSGHWITPQSLSPQHHMGVGLSLGFDRLRFLLSPRQRQPLALSRGQFLYALVCPQAASHLHAPAAHSVLTDALLVLRVHAIEGLPDDVQREAGLCRSLLAASLPEGDAWDRADLNWGVIECDVLGSFSPPAHGDRRPQFSGILAIDHPAVCLHLYQPDAQIMEMLANGTVDAVSQIELGVLRTGEDHVWRQAMHPVRVSMADLRGKRTAMFGKTRLGKSNVLKLVAQGMLDASGERADLGQIIFDVNGEYANVNPQDGDTALAQAYQSRCLTYFLTDLKGNPNARLLRFNFYQRADEALNVMREMLPADVSDSAELRNLFVCRVPRLQRLSHENDIEFRRKARKLLLFWALLSTIGCEHDSECQRDWLLASGLTQPYNPGFTQSVRTAAYLEVMNKPAPTQPFDFASMVLEMRTVARFAHLFRNDPCLSPHGQYCFDVDEDLMIALLCGNGHALDLLRPCITYHSPKASHFTHEILQALQQGQTVIVNLSSASDSILRYFAQSICTSIFHEQERKFVSNTLGHHYVQVYFEEAHNIFPPLSSTALSIYSRFAKEGAKFHIGIVYSTQSPSTINRDLLAQTENFFIGHLSSINDASCLAEVQAAFMGCEQPIMRNRTPGFMQMLTFSHRYVVPVQAHRYTGQSRLRSDEQGRAIHAGLGEG